MEEEINTLVSAGTLYKNNKNLLLSELWQTLRRKITNQTNCRSFLLMRNQMGINFKRQMIWKFLKFQHQLKTTKVIIQKIVCKF